MKKFQNFVSIRDKNNSRVLPFFRLGINYLGKIFGGQNGSLILFAHEKAASNRDKVHTCMSTWVSFNTAAWQKKLKVEGLCAHCKCGTV
jgi:hypothetical protein